MTGPVGSSGGGALPLVDPNEVLAGPDSGVTPARAAGRALVVADIPDLSSLYATDGHTHEGGPGDVVILSPDASTDNVIEPTTASVVPITIKGAASQSADLQKWTDNADAEVASVAADGSIEIDDAAAYYIGDKATNGSWRFVLSGNNLKMERRESGTWVEKAEITA